MQKLLWILFLLVSGPSMARDSASAREDKAVVLRELLLQLDISYLRCATSCDVEKVDEKVKNSWRKLKPLIPENKRLDSFFSHKSDPKNWRMARLALEDELSLTLMPASMLGLDRGKALFERHCSSCHGLTGSGDGVLASRIPKFKVNLMDHFYFENLSPTMVYNMVLSGVPGAPMYSFKDQLSDSDMWNISFFTVSLALPLPIANAKAPKIDNGSSRFGIKEVARYNGSELRSFGLSEEEVFGFRSKDVFNLGRAK